MNDPFFDEDDDAFDDLYGNPRPSASSPAVKPKQRNTDAPTAQPVTPSGGLSARSPASSSRVVSRSYARDRTGSSASTATDLAASGKRNERRKRHGKPPRKTSQELFEVQWESDAKVAKCRLCTSDFSLVRRKHHCRHCGRVMCSDCSSFLYFELSHRKHRVCATCNNQLLAEQEAYDRETLVGQTQERDTNVFDDSSDDGRPSVAGTASASTSGDIYQANRRSTLMDDRTPKHNGDDEKARKKLEKQERKERKKREKMQKKGKTPPVVNMERISRRQVEKEDKPSKKEAALFDGADDEYFTDAPEQNGRSRDSGDEYGENRSKGPGWRDRVKETYAISTAIDQPSVLPPMPGSRLTAGITGKGYISDQFRYDVGGPGLGHDDDHSVAMPRPKQQQQPVTTAYADREVKASRLTGNGYFSEQFQYDDVAGPGLGHDDDHSVAMPRPKQQQQPVTTAYADREVKPSRLTGKGYFSEQFQYDDVAGLGLGHDDDHSVAMPRPKQQQQPVTTAYADREVKPSRLTGNGYFSEQFQYDDVAGPGLGHDDDHSVAMPRPKQQQQPVTTAYADREVKPSRLTGKGYFSEQFQYDDVAGLGLGHDDDHSVAMPRPKQQQQPVTTAYADREVKPSRLTGNGYFSEQFQYDDVAGPGLGHDDDHSVAMPRPKQQQQPVTTAYADREVKPSRLTGNGYFSEQFQYDDVAGLGLGHDDDHSVAMPRPKQQQQPVTTAYADREVKPSRLTGNGYFSEQFQYDDVAGPGLGHDDDHSVAMPRPKQQQQPVTTVYTDHSIKPTRLTGNGYFSEQFQYDDVAGPGLGHDDDHSVAMPRPKQQQQPVSTTYADHSIKPSQLAGNDYFSEQFQYDDVGGPGLGHDDDHLVAMSRPKQELAATSFSYDSVTPTQKSPEHSTPPDSAGASEPEFQPRLTFKDNLKDIFGTKRRESSARKERKVKVSKPLARGNENMTLDELNPSYSSEDAVHTRQYLHQEDEPRMLTSAIPRTSIHITFYKNNAGSAVVDDSPGLFDASVAEREAQRKKEEEQQRQLASDMAWVNSSVVPPSVPARRISSEQDSYSIVDHPSQASTSPVENRRVSTAGASATGSNTHAKGGFTGALKRFFGMGSKTSEKATTPPKSAKVLPPAASTPSQKRSTETHELENTHDDSNIPTDTVSNGLSRHTVVNYYDASLEEPTSEESSRHTVAAYADRQGLHSAFETAVSSQVATQGIETTQQKPERKRRGTFDDLFESPKNDITSSGAGRYSSVGANEWTARGGDSSNVASAVGVARFDQRRSIDEADGFSFGDELKLPPTQLSSNSTEAWRRSAAMSLLDDRKDATQSEGSTFTWSNVRSVPGLGTATYAVPTSLQPRAVYNDDRASSSQYDTPSAPLGSIMDDLKRSSTIRTSPATESVDDFFAEFEEPKDYVFDPATGGYVAASAPPRVEVSRIASRSVSTELQSPRTVSDKTVLKTNERENHASSQPYEEATSHTLTENESEEVTDIIVDKISSLEGELAALKQLICNRRGSGGTTNQRYKPQVNHASARPRVRKESIFDNDSSDEDSLKPSDPYASSIRPAPKREDKRRPGSKQKHIKKRKDSFADLFEDSPNEKETIGGAASYEALFQTGSVSKMASKDADSNSDDEMEPTSKPIKARAPKSRRRSSRKKIDFTGTKDDSESDPEFVSLKGHRGRQSLRRKKNEELDDTGVVDSSAKSGDQRTTPSAVDVLPVLNPMKRQTEEEDPLDALFDSSKDRDVTKLYGEDEDHEKEDNISVLEQQTSPLLKGKSVLLTPAYSPAGSDEEGSREPSNASKIVGSSGANSSSYDPQTEDDVGEEDDFSINWTKMRKTKSRRHKSSRNSSASTLPTDDNIPSVNATDDLLFEPNLLDNVSTVDAGKPATPSAFLADASSNWMSVSTLEDDTVNLSLTMDESLESLLNTANDGECVELTVEMPVPDSHKNADTQDVASLDHGPVQELPASENGHNENSSGNDDDVELSKQISTTELSVSTIADSPTESDAAFDIFDKSGDVDFVPATSATSSIDLTISGRADESGESENDDGVSLPDENEEFSFEIKVPKARASGLDVPVAGNSASKAPVPGRSESTPPSPTSSMEDEVELGKYTTSSVPSSRTPSVDGSIDDLEDVPLPDESVLGKIESQAFDTDWNQMQAKEKERKKRLQAKQRQAQRDKVQRKQGASSRSLNGGSAAGPSKTKPKKKKKKDKDDTSSSHHKKSGSSRKHRHREKQDGDSASTSEPPRSLTEL